VIDNKLDDVNIKWSEKKAVCVVLASGGYPGAYEKGKSIHGLNRVDKDIMVFHAGTKFGDMTGQEIVTDGGRVLGVAALADTHDEARTKAFDNVKRISFDGMQYRNDIGIIIKK